MLAPETASDSAVRYLRAMIFSGQLRPGDRLPPERDLGAHLGISRMTLRLALKALESTGYIVTTRGSHGGSRVSDADQLFACWHRWMRDHADRARRHLRVPPHGRDPAGRSGRRAAHRRGPGSHAVRRGTRAASPRIGRRSSGPTWTSTTPSPARRAVPVWSRLCWTLAATCSCPSTSAGWSRGSTRCTRPTTASSRPSGHATLPAARAMAAHIGLIQQLIDRALEAAGIPGGSPHLAVATRAALRLLYRSLSQPGTFQPL